MWSLVIHRTYSAYIWIFSCICIVIYIKNYINEYYPIFHFALGRKQWGSMQSMKENHFLSKPFLKIDTHEEM